MAKVMCICGKICCGKTRYAEELRVEHKAALLSVDEIMLGLFGQHCGEMHDTYTGRTKAVLLRKAAELMETGISVVLDWGFWTREERDYVREFCRSRNMAWEFHYIDVGDETWKARIGQRNRAVRAGEASGYFVDENLALKFSALFEPPGEDEIDVWVRP